MLLAFSRAFANDLTALVGSAVSFACRTALTWLAVRSGAYMLGRDMAAAADRLRDREAKLTAGWKAQVRRDKTDIEKLRAADAMRAMVAREANAARAGAGARPPRVFSPYVVSPGPGRQDRMGSEGSSGPGRKGLGIREYDVELGAWQDDNSRVELFHAR